MYFMIIRTCSCVISDASYSQFAHSIPKPWTRSHGPPGGLFGALKDFPNPDCRYQKRHCCCSCCAYLQEGHYCGGTYDWSSRAQCRHMSSRHFFCKKGNPMCSATTPVVECLFGEQAGACEVASLTVMPKFNVGPDYPPLGTTHPLD